jgi:signal transduction histidine kinase
MKVASSKVTDPRDPENRGVTNMDDTEKTPKNDMESRNTEDQRRADQRRTDRRLNEQLFRSRERDRRLVAYEIHDGLVQHATGAQLHLERLLASESLLTGRARDGVELALRLIRKSVDEARQLISGLRPPLLDEQGVLAAVRYMIDDQPAEGPSIRLDARVRFERLEPLLEAAIFRIVQEAITNATRHGKSDRIEVRLTQVDDRLQVEIVDWGVGFDPGSVGGDRMGLQGIRERARLLGGRAEIESAPGKGARVFVELPIAPNLGEVANANDRSNS